MKLPQFYYGYVIVAAGAVTALFVWGGYNAFGVFVPVLEDDFGWSRALISGAVSLAFIVSGIASLITGRLTDRIGPRTVATACGVLLGLGYVLMAFMTSVWQLYLFLGLVVGLGLGGEMTVLPTLARWFHRGINFATGVVKTGVGVSLFLIPILAGWLIATSGWQVALAVIGLVSAAGIVIAAVFLKRDPTEMGLPPNGMPAIPVETSGTERLIPVEDRPPSVQTTVTLGVALRWRRFHIFVIVAFLNLFVTRAVLVHLPPYMTDVGIPLTTAGTLLGAVGGFSILGRLGLGLAADRVGMERVLVFTLVLMAASLLWLQFATAAWSLVVFSVVYGIAHGAYFTLFAPMAAKLFGSFALGSILGGIAFIGTLGGAAGPFLIGVLFDITGTYYIAFVILLLLSLVALFLAIALARQSR